MRSALTVVLIVFVSSCSGGTNGTNGYNGNNGQSVTTTPEPAGAHCAAGGVKLNSASGITYVCNGLSGTNGISPDGGVGPVITCTPGELTCENGKLWNCTKSGHDATPAGDCVDSCPTAPASCQGNDRVYCTGTGKAAYRLKCAQYSTSTTNPGVCATDHCDDNSGSCCRKQFPVCKWDVTSPRALTGEDYSQPCSSPPACAGDPLEIYFRNAYATCPSQDYSATIRIKMNMVTVGVPVTLPNAAVTVYSSDDALPSSCSTWTGTVTLVSAPPAWKVDLDVTCSETGETSHKVVGAISGTY